MYGRRKHQLRRLEHSRELHRQRAERQQELLRHELQMHLARGAR